MRESGLLRRQAATYYRPGPLSIELFIEFQLRSLHEIGPQDLKRLQESVLLGLPTSRRLLADGCVQTQARAHALLPLAAFAFAFLDLRQ
jgi:hypothetical protein